MSAALALDSTFPDADFEKKISKLKMLHNVLRGVSVIDMAGFGFRSTEEVDTLLKAHRFDIWSEGDLAHLRSLHHESALYLAEQHHYQIPDSLSRTDDIYGVFLATTSSDPEEASISCMILKVMHTLHHLRCRELISTLAMSEVERLSRLNARVFETIDQMRDVGIRVDEFATGQKSRRSLVTKLLAKRSASAAEIFDKLRFRIIFSDRRDLVRGLLFLLEELTPFNFVIPNESQNRLIGLDDILPVLDLEKAEIDSFLPNLSFLDTPDSALKNEFSGKSYRAVNYVADIPLRLDDQSVADGAPITAVRAEIQLVDAETEVENNRGENSHSNYKKRQKEKVKRRLEGLECPT